LNAALVRPVLLSALAATAACSLLVDLDGYSDVRPARDASADGTAIDAATLDASSADGAACVPTVITEDTFAAGLGTWVPHALRAQGYPKAETFQGGPAAVLLPVVVPIDPDAGNNELVSAHSGLWLPGVVPLVAFDLAVEVFVRCTGGGSCADGLVIAWLDTTDHARLANENSGHTAGLPAQTRGAAVVLDNYDNDSSETNDPPAPSVQLIALDPARLVGTYPWTVASTGVSFMGAWRTVAVRSRAGDVTVRYEGAEVLGAKVPAFDRGLFGFSAGTGGETDAVALRNVKASFYPCVP
jgi:hypothetical protein